MADIKRARGMVVRGHRVASGLADDPRFPGGTIALQLPLFERSLPGFADGFDGGIFAGTINIRFDRRKVVLGAPEHHLVGIAWTNWFPPENFYLSKAQLAFRSRTLPAYLYIPDPATKPDHHQPDDMIEVLAGFVRDIHYGAPVDLLYAPTAITIVDDD